MQEIKFVQDVFENIVLSSSLCACSTYDDEGIKWVAAVLVVDRG